MALAPPLVPAVAVSAKALARQSLKSIKDVRIPATCFSEKHVETYLGTDGDTGGQRERERERKRKRERAIENKTKRQTG